MEPEKWMLEHVSTGSMFCLQQGENIVGRHSTCAIQMRFEYLSRMHVNFLVEGDKVLVKPLNALNGVFMNDVRIGKSGVAASMDDRISLGVEAVANPVPPTFAVFILKKGSGDNVILLSSDDEEEEVESRLPEAVKSIDNEINIDAIKCEDATTDGSATPSTPNASPSPLAMADNNNIANCKENAKADGVGDIPSTGTSNRLLHMPMLPEMKQEILSNRANEIRDIFGEADENILGPMMELDPYVFNRLQSGSHAPACEKICDGDLIELGEDAAAKTKNSSRISPIVEEILLSDDDDGYYENFAMSQAVLAEMKAEMADEPNEELSENADDQDFMPVQIKSEVFELAEIPFQFENEDEVIEIEDDDDDALVANWSSKLLSQNVGDLSQIFPLSMAPDTDDENELNIAETEPPIMLSKRCKALRIDSSSSEDEGQEDHVDKCPADIIAPQPPELKIRRCQVRLKSCDLERLAVIPTKADEGISSRTESAAKSSPSKHRSETKDQDKYKKSRRHSDGDKGEAKISRRDSGSDSVKSKKSSSSSSHSHSSSKTANKKSTVMARRKTFDSRADLENVKPQKVIDQPASSAGTVTKKAPSTMRSRCKSVASRSDLARIDEEEKVKQLELTPKKVTEQLPKRQMRTRSKSCYMERASIMDSPAKNDLTPTKDQRGPSVILPPNLPKHRGKLRGVSAVSKEQEVHKKSVLERQRSADRMSEMKAKWLSKPMPKKPNYDDIKEKRRQQLKELAQKTTKAVPSSGEHKRKLSRDSENKHEERPAAVKIPRLIDGTFSQQLNAADAELGPPIHCSRLPERKEAVAARHQRTCNRITFAEMEREFVVRQELNKKFKKVRFSDKVQVFHIEPVIGAELKVKQRTKDTLKMSLTTYKERREWALAKYKKIDYTSRIMEDILRWSNKWLQLRNADAVADSELLMPIPHEFNHAKHFKDTFIPLMKVELLSTIEQEVKMAKTTYQVRLQSFYKEGDYFILITKYECQQFNKFDLYILSTNDTDAAKETFATVNRFQRLSGTSIWELRFMILQTEFTWECLHLLDMVTVRPVVDNLRVELGAFNAVHHIRSTPLFPKIIKPIHNIEAHPTEIKQKSTYKGYDRFSPAQVDIVLRTYHRLIDDRKPSITLIHGPPGTGKSSVISNLSLQICYGTAAHIRDRKILICAHSNTAVDHLVDNLRIARDCMTRDQFELLRFGVLDKMSSSVKPYSLQHHLQRELMEKRKRLTDENRENLLQQKQQLQHEIAELRKHPTIVATSLEQQLQSKERQLRQLRDLLDPPLTPREEFELSQKYIGLADIVCTTLSSCVKLASFVDYFDICIIDEATQCTEPWTLLPLRFSVHGLVLVGDTQQLPATVLSQKASELGLAKSMFDRIQRSVRIQQEKPDNRLLHTNIFHLNRQYRMHPEICRWPNKYFYDNQLLNDPVTLKMSEPIIPYCIINLGYTRDTHDASSRSISNSGEARFVAKLLVELDKYMPSDRYKYGLISPYMSHCNALRSAMPAGLKVMVSTVDAYQGLQKDVVIISNARTRGVGFLANYQRLNVAITRPRRCLIICGNFCDLESVDMWRHLLNDARERRVYFNLERKDEEDLHKSLISRMLVKQPNRKTAPKAPAAENVPKNNAAKPI